MTAFLAIAGVVLYFMAGFVTLSYIRYSQTVYPERWNDPDATDCALVFGPILWPLAWLVFIPTFAALRLSDRIAERGVERRKIAEADEREIKRAMRELDR